MKMRKRVFFYHYNKPASKAAGRPVLTVHYRGQCHSVDRIVCLAQTETKNQKRQPFCVVKGITLQVIFTTDKKGIRTALIT